MAKKDFKGNPAMNFISRESIEKVDGTPAEREEILPVQEDEIPDGFKLNPKYIETKSKRVQILIQPSLYLKLKKLALMNGISTNEAINQAIKEYCEETEA